MLADILLPGANIEEIINASKKSHPEKPIIDLSGWDYTHPQIVASFSKDADPQKLLSFLQKYALK